MKEKDLDLLLETCLLAGKIMMESNAEMYRIEETMNRIALAYGNYQLVSYVTQTGLFVGIDGSSTIRMSQILKRTIDLEKIAKVNTLSRNYVTTNYPLPELLAQLKKLEKENTHFPIWQQIIGAAIVSGGIMILFGGQWQDFVLTCTIGGLAYTLYHFSLRILRIKFLSEFLAAIFIGCTALLGTYLQLGNEQNMIIIGCVMPLVPGVQMTNALRDLLAGHYLSGVSRGTEAFMTASMIGFGIALVFQIFTSL